MADKIATREAYGKALVELGEKNDKVVVLDADLAGATMTKYFKAAYPDRFYDMGIAEANMVDTAAGLSTMGLIPFCSTFAMFGAGRAYEQVRNSIAYPKFNVKLCMSHAGVSVGEDGGSHQAIEDIALMRVIPGMTVIVPADANEARKAVFALADFQGPAYLRLARLASPVFEDDQPFEIGKANVLRDGTDVAIFACGLMVSESLEAAKLLEAEGIHATVINVHTIKPIDAQCVTEWAGKCGKVITVEEHSTIGGLGDAVADVLMGKVACKFHKIGVQDQFGQSGKAADVLRDGTDVAIFACGLMVNESLEAAKLLAADGIDAAVINIHTIKPIDRECVIHYAQRCSKVFTVEEHSTIGGLGDAVADVLMGVVNCGFHKIGVPDQFGQSGKAADVLKEYGLTAPQIAANIKANL